MSAEKFFRCRNEDLCEEILNYIPLWIWYSIPKISKLSIGGYGYLCFIEKTKFIATGVEISIDFYIVYSKSKFLSRMENYYECDKSS